MGGNRAAGLFLASALLFSACLESTAQADAFDGTDVLGPASTQPLTFTRNIGQWPDSILYRADGNGAVLWFTKTSVLQQLIVRDTSAEHDTAQRPSTPFERGRRLLGSVKTLMVGMHFQGTDKASYIDAGQQVEGVTNYLLGSDSTTWRHDVPSHSSLVYRNLYPGIDVTFYGNGNNIEYDIIIAPGAELRQVAIRYSGVESVDIESDGALHVRTELGEIVSTAPRASQAGDDETTRVACSYAVDSAGTVKFVAGRVLANRQLIIDPELDFSLLIGGGSWEVPIGVGTDSTGAVYIAGSTISRQFPTLNALQYYLGDIDAFVTKIDPLSRTLAYSTYLGGSGEELPWGMTVTPSGQVYVTGYTLSTDFPTVLPYQADSKGWYEGFVTRLSPDGRRLERSTYLGGRFGDMGLGVGIAPDGGVIISGTTSSSDFPTLNPIMPFHHGYQDVFVCKFNASLTEIVYSVTIGGWNEDFPWAAAVNSVGEVSVTGETWSNDFPRVNERQMFRTYDAFVFKLNQNGDSLVFSTYLGGTGWDAGMGVSVDPAGATYVTGVTSSGDFPVSIGRVGVSDYCDAFVTKYTPRGLVQYSRYLGGNSCDYGSAVVPDQAGRAVVVGGTYSTDFPVRDSLQPKGGILDAFVVKLGTDGRRVVSGTLMGGESYDSASSVTLSPSGDVYVTGISTVGHFPTTDFPIGQGDGIDAFLAHLRLDICCTPDRELRGDVDNGGGQRPDGDGVTDASDLSAFVSFLFADNAASMVECPEARDINGDDVVDGGDLGVLVDFMFQQDIRYIRRCDGSNY